MGTVGLLAYEVASFSESLILCYSLSPVQGCHLPAAVTRHAQSHLSAGSMGRGVDRWVLGACEPVLSPGVVTGCPQVRLLEQENSMTQSGACLNLSITVVVYALCLQTSPRGRADDLGEAEVSLKNFLALILGAASSPGKMSTSERRPEP